MRTTLIAGLSGFLILATISAAGANDGYVLGQGGYYWYNGQPYTRTLVTTPGYYVQSGYGYGYQYVPGQSYYSYSLVQNYYQPQTYVAPAPSYDKNWRTSVIEAAKAKQDHAQFMEAMNALNIGNPAGGGGYGANYYGANATTQYGYSLQSLVKDTGADIDRLYQYQSQLTQGAQRLAGDAMAGTTSLVQQYGEQRNRVAELLAKAEILKAANDAPSTTVSGSSVTVQGGTVTANGGQGSGQGSGPSPAVDPSRAPATPGGHSFQQLATARCASCHAGASAKGGFDVTQYGQMSAERKAKVWARLLTDDPEKLMPRAKDNGPGKRLTAEELRVFFNY